MRWRSVLFVLIWVIFILLLMFPTACQGWAICGRSSVPLAILLGIVGMALALSDAAQVRRKARAKLFGAPSTQVEETSPPK
jgi:uncharacterized membrane protein (DUF485 family)